MNPIHSGKTERLPYSLSRWTDLPAAKWPWFTQQLDQGWFVGFDPRTAIPCKWSLKVEDTYGLVFWTKDPTNLVERADQLRDYPLVIHMTLTGWEEVERGAPDIAEGMALMEDAVNVFGAERVTWRFSPVPATTDVLERFEMIAGHAAFLGLKSVYVAFLQENDLLPEGRPRRVRLELLKQMAARSHGLKVLLCNEDRTLALNEGPLVGIKPKVPRNLGNGICESGARFNPNGLGIDLPPAEGCGCALAVDPFTINESCSMGCAYCYAADKSLAPKKRNTTKQRKLTVVQ